jgi:ADP-heptose:LPS heptosyltransferase
VLLGEVEAERCSAEQIRCFDRAAEVRRPATLLELLDCLKDASVFVGNDSGPGHLAAIVGTPTVSIFGPTDPTRWGPLGPAVRVVRAMPLQSLAVADVASAVVAMASTPREKSGAIQGDE